METTIEHADTITAADTAAHDAAERDAILAAMRKWINQRPGLDPRNYGYDVDGRAAYLAEARGIARDGRDARTLLAAIEARPGITATDLRRALAQSFSGRLSWDGRRLDYTVGQYWPTEYRAAAATVLSRAVWEYWANTKSDTPAGYAVVRWDARRDWYSAPGYATKAEAEAALAGAGGFSYGRVVELYALGGGIPRYYSAGDRVREMARRAFGRAFAKRWFN